jgi:transposase InsO family protein
MGSHLLKPFVDTFATDLGIPSISVKTIEKVIKRFKFTFETRGKVRKNLTIKRARNRYAPKVHAPGFVQMDSILVLINQCRYHFMSVIDIYTKFALVSLTDHQRAVNAKAVFQQFQSQYSVLIHTVQTDNGSEFLEVFHEYLEEQKIKHVFIYPHSPRINGVVERFNRTVQEEFIDRSDELYFDLPNFEVKLQKYLSWYNNTRPHSALHYQAPLQFISQIPKSP